MRKTSHTQTRWYYRVAQWQKPFSLRAIRLYFFSRKRYILLGEFQSLDMQRLGFSSWAGLVSCVLWAFRVPVFCSSLRMKIITRDPLRAGKRVVSFDSQPWEVCTGLCMNQARKASFTTRSDIEGVRSAIVLGEAFSAPASRHVCMHAWMISEAPCERSVVLCGFWIRPSLRLHIICKDGEDPIPRPIMVGRFWDSIKFGLYMRDSRHV